MNSIQVGDSVNLVNEDWEAEEARLQAEDNLAEFLYYGHPKDIAHWRAEMRYDWNE